MRALAVRKRRGRVRHAVSEGADCWQETLCGRPADSMVLDHRGVDCPDCLEDMEKLGWSEVSGSST